MTMPFTQTLETIIGLLTSLISIVLWLREQGGPRKERDVEKLSADGTV